MTFEAVAVQMTLTLTHSASEESMLSLMPHALRAVPPQANVNINEPRNVLQKFMQALY